MFHFTWMLETHTTRSAPAENSINMLVKNRISKNGRVWSQQNKLHGNEKKYGFRLTPQRTYCRDGSSDQRKDTAQINRYVYMCCRCQAASTTVISKYLVLRTHRATILTFFVTKRRWRLRLHTFHHLGELAQRHHTTMQMLEGCQTKTVPDLQTAV